MKFTFFFERDIFDDLVIIETIKLIIALLTDKEELDCFTRFFKRNNLFARFTNDISVKSAAKTAVCRGNNEKYSL